MSRSPEVRTTSTASEILEDQFLDVRSQLISIAATLDRIDGAGTVEGTNRQQADLLSQAIQILGDGKSDRCKRLQSLFSLPYDPDWRTKFGIQR